MIMMFASCATIKNSRYFSTLTRDTTIRGFVSNDFESKIQKKDILAISISSLSKEMDAQFNEAAASSGNITNTQAAPGYFVNEKGNILVHHLGVIHVEGLTRRELQEKLQKDLVPYMKEPIASVEYLNHKVTVMGEVEKPQVLNMPNDQMSLIDVIVSSGDMTESANKADILIIRETGNEKQIKHINLENHSIFSSSWYYMQPNDIVYVQSDKMKSDKEEKRRALQTTLSLIVSGVSLLFIIINSLTR
jgi:polysaccharide export outer membrane protein